MRRLILTAGVALALVATQAGVLQASAQADSTSFVPGAGDAVAQVLSVSPALSGEDLGVESGVSIADYTGTDGQAQSQILTSALIGDLNVNLPAAVNGILAESSGTPSSQTSSVAGADGEGGALLNVTAAQSSATTSTTLAAFDLPDLLTVSGGQSTATTSIVSGQTRRAEATSSIGSVSLLGGLITLNGLKWTATQSTGAQSLQSGSFTVSSIGLAGKTVSVPVGGLIGAITLINTALAKTGLELHLPAEDVGSDGSVQETALSLGLDNSELGKELVSPYINTIQPARTLLNTILTKIDPTLGESDLVLEIALGILSGEGTLDIDLGGAYATTNGNSYANPLASGSSTPSGLGASGVTGPNSAASNLSPLLGAAEAETGTGTSPTTPTTSAAAPKASGHPTKLALQRVSSSCQSTSGGSCQTPHSVVILIALAALTAGLLAIESLRMRRRKRLLLPEDS
ncbi:MAG TPA: choice-of-anchor P family protein [Acidimicrobiales bacterium]|jgi:hypothetical protein